ncbi:hypothetical protein OSTOST_12709, partial [Ostertagia ostertagi]
MSTPVAAAQDNASTLRLLQLVPEALPTFRVDVTTLFGDYLPRHGIECELALARCQPVPGQPVDGRGIAVQQPEAALAQVSIIFIHACWRHVERGQDADIQQAVVDALFVTGAKQGGAGKKSHLVAQLVAGRFPGEENAGPQAGCKVLMVGTHPGGKGGIATVVAVLQQQGFFKENAVRYIATHAQGGGVRKLGTAIGAVCTVAWLCLTQRPAIVHVHSASRASFYRKSLILLTARLLGRKTIFHLHGAEFRQFANVESGPLARWWIRRTLASSSMVVTLSESWSGFLRELAPTARLRVVANSVSMPVLQEPAREEAGRILFLGRAEKRKGIFELLDAIALLKQEYPEVMLVIGGDGDLQEIALTVERLQIGAH